MPSCFSICYWLPMSINLLLFTIPWAQTSALQAENDELKRRLGLGSTDQLRGRESNLSLSRRLMETTPSLPGASTSFLPESEGTGAAAANGGEDSSEGC